MATKINFVLRDFPERKEMEFDQVYNYDEPFMEVSIVSEDPEQSILFMLEAALAFADKYDCMDYLGQKCLAFAKDGDFGS